MTMKMVVEMAGGNDYGAGHCDVCGDGAGGGDGGGDDDDADGDDDGGMFQRCVPHLQGC